MCGIAGVVSGRPDRRFVAATESMMTSLAHRGPDSHGIRYLGPCVLANTRLAIVDLSDRGRQPMCNEDESIWIVYNGECYNAPGLRPALIERGHTFRSNTDTEVILHLYEEYGAACVEKLQGMFGFAIWDARTQELLLARDRLGIKPLYYALVPEGIAFASEIKALLASGLVPRKLEAAGVHSYLQLGHIPPGWTAIQGVKPLDPGHVARWQNGSLKAKRYWSLPTSSNSSAPRSTSEIAGSLREILLNSCRSQLMSDVPIALFLSGGIDSAMIGSVMRHVGAAQITALTIGFDEKAFDESESSRQTAELLGIPHQVIRVPASRMIGSLDDAFLAMDQPTVDGLNAYWISRAAHEAGFKIALSGQGGDELFGGYDSLEWFIRFSHAASWMRPFPRSLGQALFDRPALSFRVRKLSYLMGADDPFVAAQVAVRFMFLERDLRDLLGPALAPPDSRSEAKDFIINWSRQTTGMELRERIAFLDIPAHLEARLLRDGDAMSMAHSLEIRPVLLDHEIVEFVMKLPISQRLQKKQLLMEAMRECLPQKLYSQLVAKPKRTFTFPFTQWLGGSMRSTIEETLLPERIRAAGVLNPGAVRQLWRRYLDKPESVGWSRLWAVFVLARWCEIMKVGV